jgi:hypothetical protein
MYPQLRENFPLAGFSELVGYSGRHVQRLQAKEKLTFSAALVAYEFQVNNASIFCKYTAIIPHQAQETDATMQLVSSAQQLRRWSCLYFLSHNTAEKSHEKSWPLCNQSQLRVGVVAT